ARLPAHFVYQQLAGSFLSGSTTDLLKRTLSTLHHCRTTTRTSVPNNLCQVPTSSSLICVQLRCRSPPPGGSFLIPIGFLVPVPPVPPRSL
ncbi:hypothetical protein ATANTOWER_005499, partial [Ataeniobius toweri]|nr:hypothetical protein [Ataeniobius toweri]